MGRVLVKFSCSMGELWQIKTKKIDCLSFTDCKYCKNETLWEVFKHCVKMVYCATSPFKSKLAADEDSFVADRANSRLLLDRVWASTYVKSGFSECGDEHIGRGDKWFTAGNCHHHRLDYLLCNFIDRWTDATWIDKKCGPMPINCTICRWFFSLPSSFFWAMCNR